MNAIPHSIAEIPEWELKLDMLESQRDIETCTLALKLGIETYGAGNSVKERIDGNKRIIETIKNELARRGLSSEDDTAHSG